MQGNDRERKNENPIKSIPLEVLLLLLFGLGIDKEVVARLQHHGCQLQHAALDGRGQLYYQRGHQPDGFLT